ncbi:MAG: hypothetical protein H7Y11_09315 [Armatimonadetes bacterium]|nr:hypothetical protein [Anaerolineae bacterium]
MRVQTNMALLKRNRTLAQIAFFASLGLLAIGFIGTNARLILPTVDANLMPILELVVPAVILPIAFISTLFSVRMTNLWVRAPRPEAVLPENLKGLSTQSVFYSYHHFPARHVLICPHGVFAIITRFHFRAYRVDGDQWSTQQAALGRVFSVFRMDNIGNPTLEAVNAAAQIQAALATIAPGVIVQPLVVFVDPRVTLTLNNPTVPVLYAQSKRQPNLKDYLKALPKSTMLTPEQINAFEHATGITTTA